MAEINQVSGIRQSDMANSHHSKTDIVVEAFGKVMLDYYEKKTAGEYTAADREKMRRVYENSAKKVENPAHFRGYFGTLCKEIGII